MRKLIAAINMSLDGFCGYTLMLPDDEIHQHYTNLVRGADTITIWKDNLSTHGILTTIFGKSEW